MRFRKSISIGKGVRLNLSKSGMSLSAGVKGASLTFGRRGTYLNTGIPGTGIYDRQRIGKAGSQKRSSNPNVKSGYLSFAVKCDDNGQISILYNDTMEPITDARLLRIIKQSDTYKQTFAKLMDDYKNQLDEKTTEIINIHTFSSPVQTLKEFENHLSGLKKQQYQRQVFEKPCPAKQEIEKSLYEKAHEEIKTLAIWKAHSLRMDYVNQNIEQAFKEACDRWEEEKSTFEKEEDQNQADADALFEEQYNLQRTALESAINGDHEYIENTIESWLSELKLPVEFSLQFQNMTEEKAVYLDIDLPEIETLPTEKSYQLANGTVKSKSKSQKELREEYARSIIGLSIYFASNIFNVSPTVLNILASGYTQRRDQKTGEVKDDYVYSVLFTREAFEKATLHSGDPLQYFQTFKNRLLMSQTFALKAIRPYAHLLEVV